MSGEQKAMAEIRKLLHDLCQPLTALECGLFLGKTEEEPVKLRTAIEDALVQCHRMMGMVRALQQTMDGLATKDGEKHGNSGADAQGAAGRNDDAVGVAG